MKFIRFAALVSVLSLVGCNNGGGSGTAMLTKLTEFTTSPKCPNGGVKITAGPDTDASGALDAAEVTQTSEVCNGAGGTGAMGMAGLPGDAGPNGATALVSSTNLPIGSTACPSGGVHLDLGVDDGMGGGTAGNGVLETGEIRTAKDLCNGTGAPYFQRSLTAPAGAAGIARVSVRGGNASAQPGGNAGTVTLELTKSTAGGHVKLFKTGAVDAGFAVIPAPALAYDAGTRAWAVTTNSTVRAYTSMAAGIASDDEYFIFDDSSYDDDLVYAHDGGLVSSISVAPSTTLTLSRTDGGPVQLELYGDFKNEGVVTSAIVANRSPNFAIQARNIVLAPGSQVIANSVDGGAAGDISIGAANRLYAQGLVSAAGPAGGTGGRVVLSSNQDLFSTGAVEARGANSTTATGGTGGTVFIVARTVSNSGTIRVTGGNGQYGGTAGSVLVVAQVGVLKNSGVISATGGSCTVSECNAGGGGQVRLEGQASEVFTSGAIDTSGGAANGPGTTQGGAGGSILISSTEIAAPGQIFSAAGSVHASGELLAEGGSGYRGGGGGSITASVTHDVLPLGQEVELFGYGELNASGGDSNGGSVGSGGSVSLMTGVSTLATYPGGGIANSTTIIARAGTGGFGNTSGSVMFSTQPNMPYDGTNEHIINAGEIDVSNSVTTNASAQSGGTISFTAMQKVENRGVLKANGGNMSGATNNGGAGGSVTLRAIRSTLFNDAAFQANGGLGGNAGGEGGTIIFQGSTSTVNSGALSCTGGNATGTGGDGGSIRLQALVQRATTNTGLLSVGGGTGATSGHGGAVIIDRYENP